MRSKSGSENSESRKSGDENDQEFILDLLLAKRFWTVYNTFKVIKGTRVWENRFTKTDLPLIIECVEEDSYGNPLYPHWMLLTEEHFHSCRKGKPDRNGEKTR